MSEVTDTKIPFFSLTQSHFSQVLEIAFPEKQTNRHAEKLAALYFKSIYPHFVKYGEIPSQQILESHNIYFSKDFYTWANKHLSFALAVKILEEQFNPHDGSIKFVIQLISDGSLVECVLMPEKNRLTLCVSTQVGCAQGCRFCQTGRMGLIRNLTTEEIVSQLLVVEIARKALPVSHPLAGLPRITNIVYMGMGEPLDNLQAVISSSLIFADEKGLRLSPNKITVSTVGLMPQLEEFLQESKASLALSLHSPFDEERSKIMPVNLRHPLHNVIDVLKSALKNGQRKSFMIQYTLLRNTNDTKEHCQALIKLFQGMKVKINIIPLNEHDGTGYRRPDLVKVYDFQQTLKDAGFVATVRLSKGREIQAACGQLVKLKSKES